MNTMNTLRLKALRRVIEAMLTLVQRWEDARPDDYRLSDLRTGLWQASDALRQIIEGEVIAGRRHAHIAPQGGLLTPRYRETVLRDSSNPVRSTNV
jgi:hypothetical protein